MVMSITSALQQKHQEEQNSLCNAVKLLMQSPGYIEEFVRNFFFCFPSRQVGNTVNVRILLIASSFFFSFFFLQLTLFSILLMDATLDRERYNVTSSKVRIIAY